MNNKQTLFVQMVLDAWNTHIARLNKLFESLTDEELQQQVAENRNTGVYLLGHLTAVHDGILPLLNLGEKMYPELENIFIKNPDKPMPERPSVTVLRQYWNDVNNALAAHFSKMSDDGWFLKHNAVSAEDFIKEPNRNRLNLLINRTNHAANHLGQLTFLKR